MAVTDGNDNNGGTAQHKAKMRPKPGSPPGIELDGHGETIPFAQRTEDDKRAALSGVKNPQHEAENPGAIPEARQGEAANGRKPHDPEGHQGRPK